MNMDNLDFEKIVIDHINSMSEEEFSKLISYTPSEDDLRFNRVCELIAKAAKFSFKNNLITKEEIFEAIGSCSDYNFDSLEDFRPWLFKNIWIEIFNSEDNIPDISKLQDN